MEKEKPMPIPAPTQGDSQPYIRRGREATTQAREAVRATTATIILGAQRLDGVFNCYSVFSV